MNTAQSVCPACAYIIVRLIYICWLIIQPKEQDKGGARGRGG